MSKQPANSVESEESGSVTISRREGECIAIGEDVLVKVIKTAKGGVKLRVTAPRSVRVLRRDSDKKM